MTRLVSYPCLEAVYRELPFALRQKCLRRIPELRKIEPRVAYTFNEVRIVVSYGFYMRRVEITVGFDDQSWRLTVHDERGGKLDDVIQYFLARPGTRIRHLFIKNIYPKLPIEIAGRRIEKFTLDTTIEMPPNYFDELRAAGLAFGDVSLDIQEEEEVYDLLVGIPMDTLTNHSSLLPRPEQLLGLSVRKRLEIIEYDYLIPTSPMRAMIDDIIERLSNFHIVTSALPDDFGLSFSYRIIQDNEDYPFCRLVTEPEFQQGLRRIGARKVRNAYAHTLNVSDRMELLIDVDSEDAICIKNIPRGSAKKFVKKWSRGRTSYCSSRLRPRRK